MPLGPVLPWQPPGTPFFQKQWASVVAPERTHGRLEIEAELNGPGSGWTDLTPDLARSPALSIEYGIPGAGPLDLVASTGQLSFTLKNGENNSVGRLGYYSPEHANCRAGFKVGIAVRFRYLLNGTTYYKFSGWLATVDPLAGQFRERKTLCLAKDYMEELGHFRPRVPTQVGRRADQCFAALISQVPRQPTSTNYDVADSTFAYAFDNSQSEAQPAITEAQRIAQSEYGRIYSKGDTVAGGVLRMEKRTARLAPMVVATFDDDMVNLSAPHDRGVVLNRIKATMHPRRVDGVTTTVLFSNQGTPSVSAGATLEIEGRYNDPANRASRVGGTDMTLPVATTDYTMNTVADGSGADLTASFQVTAGYGGNTVKYKIVDGSASAGFITKLQARGRGLYDYDPIDVLFEDLASIALYGEALISLDMPYQGDATVAKAVADYIGGVWSSPGSIEVVMGVNAVTDAEVATVIALEPGDAIAVRETATGVDFTYFINHVSIQFETDRILSCEYVLQRALVLSYWTLGIVGKSELGQTTVLAPF